MHIMLFGGSFDPPHNGHKQIAEIITKKNIADQVWFIPCYSHPFSKALNPSHHRLVMTQLLANHAVLVSDYEIEKGGTSYSFDTLTHFQKTHPQHTFSWLIGSDQLADFHKWKNYGDFLKKAKVYVYPREGFAFEPLYDNMIPLKDFPLVTISSTHIREAVAINRPIHELVPKDIQDYIEKKNLYT